MFLSVNRYPGWLDMFGYEVPAEEGAAWSRLINRELMAFAKAEPRVVPLATVPLQQGTLDTLVHDARTLRFLADMAGADRLMLGSDMPFPIGDLAPRKIVEACGFPAAEHASIEGGLASRLFAL
jgi:amidohydrolase family protein